MAQNLDETLNLLRSRKVSQIGSSGEHILICLRDIISSIG